MNVPSTLLAAAIALAGPPDTSVVPIGFLNAGELRTKCLSNSAASISYCYAYIAGVNDAVKAYEAWLTLHEYCAPPNTSQSDLRATFLAYMAQKPEYSGGEAASVVVVALKQRFTCGSDPSPASH